jgi:glycine/D-amino acid oxidase-like deaminating enzyme
LENPKHVEIAILGAGIAGIAAAYYLCTKFGKNSVLLIDNRQPLSFTTAQSGDNYRNLSAQISSTIYQDLEAGSWHLRASYNWQ